jgi:hypothetical protein
MCDRGCGAAGGFPILSLWNNDFLARITVA